MKPAFIGAQSAFIGPKDINGLTRNPGVDRCDHAPRRFQRFPPSRHQIGQMLSGKN